MVEIKGYQFETGYTPETNFNNVAAVYVVYTNDVWLDVGETDELGSRIQSHERKGCWERNAGGKKIWIAVRQEGNKQGRLALEAYLRRELRPKCGEV